MKAAPYCQSLVLISLLGVTAPAAIAQPITPAKDGTGTIINRSGDRFDVTGGSLSNNDANLFHSFQQFSLDTGQTANFVSAPNIQNILGRVTGGNASIINGLIQVSGGQSNLYLMNPAGVLFGPNARLDVPASFSVTTATGIGLGNNWFNAVGTNDYQNLVGTPNRYRFDLQQPGAIVNSGDLELSPGHNLTLTGGTVINTGQLSTPGGNVTIAAVEGGDVIRISQEGHLLNLEISSPENLRTGKMPVSQREITPLSLPGLLTEGNANSHATGMRVNQRGEVVLTGPGAVVTEMGGVAIASGSIDVSGNVGGQVNVLGDRVGILNANINADGINGGGSIFVGGDFQGSDRLPASQQTVINNNSFISANAIENGDGGRVIIWSDGTTRFEGNISATGGASLGDGGLVEVSGKEQLLVNGFIDVTASNGSTGTILFDPENIIIDELAADFEADVADELSAGETTEEKTEIETRATSDPFAPNEDYNVTISAENIEQLEGNVTLQADNDITVNQEINTYGSVELKAGRSINVNADIDTSRGNGDISLFGNDNNANPNNRSSGPANITQRNGTTLNAGSGNITIELGFLGEIGDINLANLTTTGRAFINANSGNINRVSPNSLITANDLTLQTLSTSGVGSAAAPLRLDVNNLEVKSGTGGAFILSVADLNIGGTNDRFNGITSAGDSDVRIDARGEITVSEPINGGSDIELRTSESIKINNDINSRGEGSIILQANDENLGVANRSGRANILQAEDTTMDADRGNIEITLGDLGKKGDINVSNLTTTEGILIDGNGGNIGQVGNNSLINGGGLLLINRSGGSIGNPTTPLRVDVDNLEAVVGGGGLFLESIDNFSIGGVNERLTGILNTQKRGEIILEALGDISVEETITNGSNTTLKAGGNLNLNAQINATEPRSNISLTSGGSININADINTADGRNSGNIYLQGNDENTANENTAEEAVNISMAEGTVLNAGSGDIEIKLGNYGWVGDINLNNLTTRGNVLIDANSGDITTVSADSLITANRAVLISYGYIGADLGIFPLNLNVNNLEVKSGGIVTLAAISDINLGGASENLTGITADWLRITAEGDINVNEPIQTGRSTLLIARDSIRINADISANLERNNNSYFWNDKGSLVLWGNDYQNLLLTNEENLGGVNNSNKANIVQARNTTIDAGDGNLQIGLGYRGEVGDIILENLTTNENVFINANGGNIRHRSDNSLITARNASFFTLDSGGIGTSRMPMQLKVYSLEATAGSGGAFFNILGSVSVGIISRFDNPNIAIITENGGDVELSATRHITILEDISTATENGKAGNIRIESFRGSIDSSFAIINGFHDDDPSFFAKIDASSASGRGGNISLTAAGDINTNHINSSAGGNRNAGNIVIESRNGAFSTVGRFTGRFTNGDAIIDASSFNGNGGRIRIKAANGITTADITSASGEVVVNEGGVSFMGGRGNGGNIILDSEGNINTTTGTINSSSMRGDGGTITLRGDGDIQTASVVTSSRYYDRNNETRVGPGRGNGGNIMIESDRKVSSEVLDTTSTAGDGGEISIRSGRNINANRVYSSSYGSGNGGSIDLDSGGNINTGYNSEVPESREGVISSGSVKGNGGNVSLVADGNINLHNIFSFSAGGGNGGSIDLYSERDVSVRNSIISGSLRGNGGDVSITAESNIQISNIITTSGDIQIRNIIQQQNVNASDESNLQTLQFDRTRENDFEPPYISALIKLLYPRELTSAIGDYGLLLSWEIPREAEIRRRSATSTSDRIFNTQLPNGNGGNITLNAGRSINTTGRQIVSGSSNGTGGNIDLNAGGDILTGDLFSRSQDRETNALGEGTGGNITLSAGGNIDTTEGQISSASAGDGGNVSIESRGGNIETGEIVSFSDGNGKGGDISLNAEGNINTTDDDLNSQSQNLGGDIEITAGGNINTGNVKSSGENRSGDIDINSTDGRINTTLGRVNSSSDSGIGGQITLSAEDRVNAGNITAWGERQGGDIGISSNNGEVNVTVLPETNGEVIITSGGESAFEDSIQGPRNITIEDGGENNPFRNRPNADTSADSDRLNERRGDIKLQAHNDVTINESIETTEASSLEITAGRNINVNANIDTSANNGNIILEGNSQRANPNFRGQGPGNINMAPDTTVNAGSGAISIRLGTGEIGQVGNINLANLMTTGDVTVDASGGSIFRASENSLITAGNATFETQGSGAIGSAAEPLRLQAKNLEAAAGSGGAFFNFPNNDINIGGVSSDIDGVSTINGGDLEITTESGDITATEQISTASGGNSETTGGSITINVAGNIDTTQASISTASSRAGNVTLNATGDISTEKINTGGIDGPAGNITVNAGEAIDTTAGELTSNSNVSDGGDISLTANEDISTSRATSTSFSGGDGGNIRMESTKGSITTGSPTESLSADADITNPEIVNRFDDAQSNLDSKAEDGSGGNIELVTPGDITTGNISSRGGVNGGNVSINGGNINTSIIFTVAVTGSSGNIDLIAGTNENSLDATRTASQSFNNTGNINVNHLATYSNQGIGGDITINATGSFNVNQLASFGLLQSGDVILNSSNNRINTGNITTQSEGGPSGNISANATDVGTGNLRSIGRTQAGQIQAVATDGSIITLDLESISTEGEAGGIDLDATENIETGDQTVAAAEGDANINVDAGENASTADQTATTGDGNANINLNTGGNASTEDQTAATGNGNANIQVRSGGDITGENQAAFANNGDASIGTEAGGNVNLRDQIATANNGNASIANAAAENIGISNDQTATANNGNASIDNQAGGSIGVGGSQTATGDNASINNVAGDNINVGGDQTSTATGGNASVNNQAGNNINVGGDQTSIANGGDATINNVAGGNIAVGNQTALSDGGNASINNDAGGSLTTGEQIAIAPDGIETINNNLPGNEVVEQIIPNQGSVIPNNNPVLFVENNVIGGGTGLNSRPATTNLFPVNPSGENLQPSNSGATPLNFNPTIETLPNSGDSTLPQSFNVSTPLDNTLPERAIAPTSIPGVSNNLDNTNPVLTVDSSIRNVVTENIRTNSNPDAIVNNIDGEMNSNASTEKTLQRAFTLNTFNLLNSWELGENFQELIDLEESRIREYVDYFGEDILDPNFYLKNPQEILVYMAKQTGYQSAVIYVTAYDDRLQLVLYTATGDPIIRNDYSIKKDEILKMAEAFQQLMSNPNKIGKQDYFQQAQKFYDLLIRPIQRDLDAANIDTLLFSMGSGLRRLPLAALHDGQQFLVEKYGLSMIPSMSLMDSRYRNLEGARVLGMGVEYFETKESLPAVSLELKIIEDFRPSDTFINEEFTRDNLIAQRQNYPYEIIHLATHSNIDQHHPQSSYIQLWDDETLGLNQIRELEWNKPPVELLILSSCRAVVENKDAELGFAGLAVATGVKSAIAGLWAVNDQGTLALMSEFYNNLDEATIKAEALRKAQLAMIRGEVKIDNGQLWISGKDSPYPLPPELKGLENLDLSHPYYWSAFTIIGSPW